MICDFCSQAPVAWSYPARSFQRELPRPLGTITAVGSKGQWMACEECHQLIQRSDRDLLAERSASMLPLTRFSRSIRRTAVKELRAVHDDFWRNREGEPRRVTA